MAKVKGVDVYVEVNTGTYAMPVWTKVGGQKGATMTLTLGEISITDKDSNGWEELLVGNRSVEISFDAFLIEDDAGFQKIKNGFWAREILDLRLSTPTKTYRGNFILTELPLKAPEDNAVVVSFTLKSAGEVTEA